MSFLSKYFSPDLVFPSPVQKTYDQVSDFVDGVEVRSFVEVDYPKIVASHGSVVDWSLESLVKAGINPSFAIRTSSTSRLDDASSVSSLNSVVDSILNFSE